MSNETAPGCTQCGSERVTWRIKRNRAAARDSRRELLWTCGICGFGWTEPLTIPPSAPELEPAG